MIIVNFMFVIMTVMSVIVSGNGDGNIFCCDNCARKHSDQCTVAAIKFAL